MRIDNFELIRFLITVTFAAISAATSASAQDAVRVKEDVWKSTKVVSTGSSQQPAIRPELVASMKKAPISSLEDVIRKEIDDFDNAIARYDVAAVMSHFADVDGMVYTPDFGRITLQRVKQ